MVKKFRKRGKIDLLHKLNLPIQINKKVDKNYVTKKGTFPICDTDRITYILELDENYQKAIITCVSLDILFNEEWISIERFDTEHGYLHWHVLTKIGQPPIFQQLPTNFKKHNSLDYIFTWVVNHLYSNYYFYRRHFIKNNKDKLKNTIDNY